jgi:nitric oxide reductase subunit C
MTKVYSSRGENWLRIFMKNPESTDPQRRKMPNLKLSDDEIKKLIAFFKWVDAIDTNEWPPKPITVAKATGAPLKDTAQTLKGKNVYNQNRCDLCHRIGGQGGIIGPDLSHVGAKRDTQWLSKLIKNPKSINPATQMPAYPQLSEDEVQALVSFLGGLK